MQIRICCIQKKQEKYVRNEQERNSLKYVFKTSIYRTFYKHLCCLITAVCQGKEGLHQASDAVLYTSVRVTMSARAHTGQSEDDRRSINFQN